MGDAKAVLSPRVLWGLSWGGFFGIADPSAGVWRWTQVPISPGVCAGKRLAAPPPPAAPTGLLIAPGETQKYPFPRGTSRELAGTGLPGLSRPTLRPISEDVLDRSLPTAAGSQA